MIGLLVLVAAGDDDSGLTLSDLTPYRAALERPAEGPTAAVTFRDLWNDPSRYRGRRVRVEGRVVRRFKQGAVGTFPALVEVWAVSPVGDPFCLVFPAPTASPAGEGRSAPDPAPGASVRFEGTYLKKLRYRGSDTDRLAPLIVGSRPPTVTSPAPPRDAAEPQGGPDRTAWVFGLVAAGLVGLALARRHLNAPPRRPSRPAGEEEPPPEFVDGA